METAFKSLVYAFDIFNAGANTDLTDDQKALTLTEELMTTEMPTLDHRSIQLALTFLRYFYNQKNPNATEEQFQASLSVESAANAAASVKKQMQETITLDELKEFQKVQSLNLTRVNKDRQVQD